MLAVGTTIGVAHSFEADHVAAVASLVDEEHSGRAGLIGTSWGVGHAIPIAAVGLLFLVVGSQLPDGVALAAEALAGLVLVLLGARVVWSAVEPTRHTHDHAHSGGEHSHGGGEHSHDGHRHAHGGREHAHVSIGGFEIGSTHSHREGESFLVGVVHGLAGSGVAVGGLATGASLVEGASLLGAFAVASVVSMGTLALLWGTIVSRTASRAIQSVAGVVAIAVGLLLLGTEVIPAAPV